ncbi:MAG: chorismate-binding protein [Phycisphaerales bacterium]
MRAMIFPGSPGTELPWTLSPLEALRRWPIGQRVLMLHSGRPDARWSRYTLLARADGAYRFVADQAGGGRSEWIGTPESCHVHVDQFKHRPLRDLGQVLADRESLWIGYLGYDLGRYIEKLPSMANDDRGWPIVQMQRCPGWLVHDNVTGQWRACGAWRDFENSDVPHLPALPVNDVRFHADTPRPLIDRAAHERAIARALEYIAAGDIFQVNLTQRFTAKCNGNPRALYDTLARQSPAWYGAYLELETSQDGETHNKPPARSPATRPSYSLQSR